ncbi:hypothetical protein ASE09_18425 [Streptomyces sp. Root66D1]|nr:hypothetical protein ASD33_14485 [Streptomyces sp. Root1304]KRA80098.1 hypothetical protein ASE09_18425 [Streptomyces sp. Root66D1]
MGRTGRRDTATAAHLPRSLPHLTSRRHIDLLRVCSAASPPREGHLPACRLRGPGAHRPVARGRSRFEARFGSPARSRRGVRPTG